jgi:predicted component of type VI protein secretion system
MVTLRLFRRADPFKQVAARVLADAAEIAVGRDPGCDWHIEDDACELSRRHCLIVAGEDGVRIRDVSANGVFVGPNRRRLAKGEEVDVKLGEPVHLGQFMIVADAAVAANDSRPQDQAIDAPFHSPILVEPEISAATFSIGSAWAAPVRGADAPRLPDAALLEAFCDGAGIDPSVFAGEVPSQVMRRAGETYRQAVIGLCDLMGERTSIKSAYRLERTTVNAAGNNPFKWTDAHRVGVDLLRAGNGSFLAGAAAIKESFEDLKKHLLCLVAGSRQAVAAALEEVGPERVEEGVKGQSPLFQNKAEACWRQFLKLHAHVCTEARENADGAINRAFKAGYERHIRKLDGLGTMS